MDFNEGFESIKVTDQGVMKNLFCGLQNQDRFQSIRSCFRSKWSKSRAHRSLRVFLFAFLFNSVKTHPLTEVGDWVTSPASSSFISISNQPFILSFQPPPPPLCTLHCSYYLPYTTASICSFRYELVPTLHTLHSFLPPCFHTCCLLSM